MGEPRTCCPRSRAWVIVADDDMLNCLCHMQGAARSFGFASGMAALSVVLRLVRAGQHVVAGDDIYGGTSRLLAQVAPGLGIAVTNVDTTDIECAISISICIPL